MWQYAVNKDLDVSLFAAAAAAAVVDWSAQHAVPPPAYRVSSPSAVKSALVVSSAPPTRTAARRHMLPPEIFLANIIRKSFVSNVYLMLNVALSTIYTSYELSKCPRWTLAWHWELILSPDSAVHFVTGLEHLQHFTSEFIPFRHGTCRIQTTVKN